jgi:hypothetical protein
MLMYLALPASGRSTRVKEEGAGGHYISQRCGTNSRESRGVLWQAGLPRACSGVVLARAGSLTNCCSQGTCAVQNSLPTGSSKIHLALPTELCRCFGQAYKPQSKSLCLVLKANATVALNSTCDLSLTYQDDPITDDSSNSWPSWQVSSLHSAVPQHCQAPEQQQA